MGTFPAVKIFGRLDAQVTPDIDASHAVPGRAAQ
jgi:hypothetical protein